MYMNLSQLKFNSLLNFTVTSLLSLAFHSQRLKHKDHAKIFSFSKIKIVIADMDQQERNSLLSLSKLASKLSEWS